MCIRDSQVTFSASGEMDNGFTISTSIEMDNFIAGNSDRSISIDTGDMGKLTFSGSGTSGPIGAWDDVTPSANEEAHGTATAGTAAGAANAASSANRFVYDYTAMDGLAIKAAYTPSAGTTSVESSTEIGALYTGIEGLSVYLEMGENNDQPTTGITGKSDLSAMAVTYAIGAITGRVSGTLLVALGAFTALGVGITKFISAGAKAESQALKLEAILNEADNGLLNAAGTIAMARTNAPHSATSQFFINVNNGLSYSCC